MNLLLLVLVAVLAFSTLALAAQARGLLPSSVRVSGPIISVHTERGKDFLDRLSDARWFWRVWTGAGLLLAAAVMIGTFLALPLSAWNALTTQTASQVTQPQNVLVIPGVNDFLPASVAPEIVFGLLIGLVVHEGGHGILSRVADVDIESMGVVLLSIVPIAAFVEPDPDDRDAASRLDQALLFAGGVTNNFALTAVCLLLLFGPVTGAVAVADGAPVGSVAPGSPAAAEDIGSGDRIVAVDGTSVDDADELETALATAGPTVAVETADGATVSVERELFLSRATPAVTGGIESGDEPPRVESVGGEPVRTEAAFRAAFAEQTTATVVTSAGEFDLVGGAYVAGIADGSGFDAAVDADPAAGQTVVITRVDGERVVTATELTGALEDRSPGDRVPVEVYVDGEARTQTVTLGGEPGDARLGVALNEGTGGIAVNDFGVDIYPASGFLQLLGGDAAGGIGLMILTVLTLPLISAVEATPYNFAGFTGVNTEFYVAPGLPDPVVFGLANVLFWTAWVNLNLGAFNCIPSFPLDGGHILRITVEAVVDRLPVGIDQRRGVVLAVTATSGILMVGSFLLLLVGDQVGGALGL